MNISGKIKQRGLSIIGFLFVLAFVALAAVLALKIAPTVSEFMSVKRAIVAAKAAGTSVAEIRSSFDKQADVAYIDSIKGSDLNIEKTNNGFEVSFAYEKKIPLIGPASLVLDYEGSTAPTKLGKPAAE